MSFRIEQLNVLNLATVGNSITAGSFVKSGGTSSQFLKADGSVDSNAYITGITSGMVTTALGYTPVPTTRTLTINGVAQDLSVDRSWTISVPVSSVSGSGAGISVSPTTGAVVVSNTGVTSNVAGTGISVSGATGAVTITNTGVTSIVAGTAISISGATGAVTINNTGVTSLNGSTGALTGFATQAWVTSQGYITGNQTITLSGDVTGSGATSIATTLANSGVAAGTYGGNNSIPSLVIDAKGRVTSASTVTPSGTWGISISGNAATASTSTNVTVNSGNGSAAWYPIVWHSGNTLYSSSGTAEIYPAGGYARFNYINTSDNDESGITRFIIKNGDNYHRSATTTTAMTVIRGVASGSWGIDITGNSATTTNFRHLGAGVNYDNDRTTKVSGGLAVYSGYSTGANRPTTYDISAQFSVNGSMGMEIAADWISTSGPNLLARSLRDCCQNWSSWITLLTSINYNSYSPTLTGGGASGTWGINITGSAGSASSASSVPWTGVSSGTRTNYDLRFQPPSSGYAGFEFYTSTGGGAGYFLVRGTSDNDVYTAEGITLVADAGWLTLAQRTQSNKGVRIMTGASSTTRLQIDSSGNIDVGLGAGTVTLYYGGSSKFWTGSDGTRTQGWSYFQNTSQGLHWPGNNWHLHPASGSDFIIRSGSNTDSALRFDTNGTTRGYVYSENDNSIGFLNNSRNWSFRTYSNGNALVYGYLTVNGAGTSSSIYMNDSDEGQREIHCNSNRIGFLTQAGSWGAWLYDSADWEAASSVRAPIFYDSDNTAYYGNFASTSRMNNLILGSSYSPSYEGQLVLGHTSYNFNFLNGSWSSSITAGILANCADEYEFAIHDGGNSVESLFIYQSSTGRILMGRDIGWGTTPIQAASDFRAPIFYDSDDTSYYGNFASSSTSLRIAGGIAQNNIVGRPAAYWGSTGTTGAVVIKFPGNTGNYGMVHAVIDIYEYNGNDVCTVIVGGHNWGSAWYNYGAQVIGNTDKSVRVGVKDGQYCIVIGNGSSSWSYGQVVLRKIQNGTYYSGVMDVAGGYTVAIESDSYSWISGDLRNLETPLNFYAGSNIYMGGNIVATQSWVNSQGFATGGPFVPVSGGVNMTGSYGLNDSRLYLRTNGDTNHYLWNASDDWEELGAYAGTGFRVTSNNGANGLLYVYGSSNGGYTYSPYSFRAPIFYDSDDTNYYGNFASFSYLNQLGVADWQYIGGQTSNGQSNYQWEGATYRNPGDWTARLIVRRDNSTTGINGAIPSLVLFNNNGGDQTTVSMVFATNECTSGSNSVNLAGIIAKKEAAGTCGGWSPGSLTFFVKDYGTRRDAMYIATSGYVQSDYSFRAPIFYDSDNTAYYGNFASTSVMNSITFGTSSTGATLSGNGDWGVRFSNSTGYIQIGPANTSYAHIYTDRGNFYFNVDYLYMNGNRVYGDNYRPYADNAGAVDGVDSSQIVYGGAGRASTSDSNMNDPNQKSGFYYYSSPTGQPFGDWWNWMTVAGNSWQSSNNYSFQIAHAFHSDDAYIRRMTNGTAYSWRTLITSGNIGSQSVSYASSAGNADTVDGFHATAFPYRSGGSSGYYQVADWMQFNTSAGLYWPSYNGAHIYPNPSSYGSIRIDGSRNGWYGIEFGNAVNLMANTNESGFHNNNYGWHMRWYQGTMYVRRSTYGGGTEYTVLDSGNYSSWAIARGGDTVTGLFYFTTNNGGYSGSLVNGSVQIYSNSNNSAYFSFHKGGYYAVNMGLDADSVLRIGGWSAASNRWQLDMSGNMTVAGDVTAYSDARVKENVETVEDALDKVLNLRGVYYNRIDSEDKRRKVGVIAQEILEVIPEVVGQDNDGMYNVSYGNIVGVLIEAIKEQQKQIDELKARLD